MQLVTGVRIVSTLEVQVGGGDCAQGRYDGLQCGAPVVVQYSNAVASIIIASVERAEV